MFGLVVCFTCWCVVFDVVYCLVLFELDVSLICLYFVICCCICYFVFSLLSGCSLATAGCLLGLLLVGWFVVVILVAACNCVLLFWLFVALVFVGVVFVISLGLFDYLFLL